MPKEILVRECVNRVRPATDNTLMFDVLTHVAGLDATPLKKALQKFHQDLGHKMKAHEKVLSKQLQKRGISGGAVIPSLTADPE